MWGDYWMKSKFESAMVGIDFMTGPDPDATDYFASRSIGAQGRRRTKYLAIQKPRGRRAPAAKGATTLEIEKRKADLQEMQATVRDDLPSCRSSNMPLVEGTKKGQLEASSRTSTSRSNTLERERLVLGDLTIPRGTDDGSSASPPGVTRLRRPDTAVGGACCASSAEG